MFEETATIPTIKKDFAITIIIKCIVVYNTMQDSWILVLYQKWFMK